MKPTLDKLDEFIILSPSRSPGATSYNWPTLLPPATSAPERRARLAFLCLVGLHWRCLLAANLGLLISSK